MHTFHRRNLLASILTAFLSAFIISCTSEQVVSNGFLQKRKYRKGFYLAGLSKYSSQAKILPSKKENISLVNEIKEIPIRQIENPTLSIGKLMLPTHKKLLSKKIKDEMSKTNLANDITSQNTKPAIKSSTPFRDVSLNDKRNGKVTPINYSSTNPESKQKHTFGLLSLIFGFTGFIIPPLCIAAIVFGLLSKPNKLGKAGLILGIIALIVAIIAFAIAMLFWFNII